METIKFILDILYGALTPLIAIIAVYIACQQYKINRARLNNELYERRITIFKAVMKFISEVIQNVSPDIITLSQFYADTGEADFLFESDIRQYIDTLYENGRKLGKLADQLSPADDSSGLPKVNEGIKEKWELFNWFSDELPNAKKLFKRYLSI